MSYKQKLILLAFKNAIVQNMLINLSMYLFRLITPYKICVWIKHTGLFVNVSLEFRHGIDHNV